MDISNINIWGVLVATLFTFLVGWLWYGPLFGKAGMKEIGVTESRFSRETWENIWLFFCIRTDHGL